MSEISLPDFFIGELSAVLSDPGYSGQISNLNVWLVGLDLFLIGKGKELAMLKWFLSLFSRRAPQPALPVIIDKEDSSNHVIHEEDLVLDLPHEAKLENFKRAKPPARTRPTVRPTAPVKQEKQGDAFKEDEGIDQFFGSTAGSVSAARSPSPIANKKSPTVNPRKSADTKKKSPWTNFNPFGNKEKTDKKRSKASLQKASETEDEKSKDDKQNHKTGSKPIPPAAAAKPKVTDSNQESRKEESVERKPKELQAKVEEEKKYEKKEEGEGETKKAESFVEVKPPQELEKHANTVEKEPGEITRIDGDKMDETKKELEDPDKEKTEELAPKVPLVVPKRPILPGMGIGGNVLAQMKAEQEKRKSMIPNTNISLPTKSPVGEKKVPLFPRNLKPVNEPTLSPQPEERLTQEIGNKKSVGDGVPKSPLNKIRISDKPNHDITTKSAEKPNVESCPEDKEQKKTATGDDSEDIKDAPISRVDIVPPVTQKDSDGSNADSHGKSDQRPAPRPRPQIKTAKPKSLVEAEGKPIEKEHENEKQKHPEEKLNEKEHEKHKHLEEKEHVEKQKQPEEKPNKKEHEEKQKHPDDRPNKKEHEEKQKHTEERPNTKDLEKEKQKHTEERPNKKEHEEKQKHTEERPNKKDHEEKQKHKEGRPNENEKEKQKHQESGVVYDSATIRLSLKEKMALFGEQNIEDKQQKSEKSNSLPRGVKPPKQIDEKRPFSMFIPVTGKGDSHRNSKESEEMKVEVKQDSSSDDEDAKSESDSETATIKSDLRSSASLPDLPESSKRDSSSSDDVIMV